MGPAAVPSGRQLGSPRRWWAGALSAACAGMVAGCSLTGKEPPTEPMKQTRPNVVVVETDDQTVESLRVMSEVKRHIAEEGVTFKNSFVSLPQCCPSRATLLTGQYAHNHGVLANSPPAGGYPKLDGDDTLASWLQRAGYHTALVGKYLNGYGERNPREVPPGWSEWWGLPDATSYEHFDFQINHDGRLLRVGREDENFKTDYLARVADGVIRRRGPSAKPFFLWLAVTAPHRGTGEVDGAGGPKNAVPAPRHDGEFDSEPVPRPPSFDEADVSDKPRAIRQLPRFNERRRRRVEERYRKRLESLLSVDESVAKLVKALEETGDLHETLLVFTSDNGFLLGDHRLPSGKILPYEASIRVPLVMRGPGIPKGVRRSQLVTNADLTATFVALARAQPTRVLDGLSLLPLARDARVDPGRDVLLESGPEVVREGSPRFTGIRSRQHVYVEYVNGERELYDLRRDPYQLENVATDPRYRDIRRALAGRLGALRDCRGAGCRASPR